MDKNNIYRKLREETETNETPELTQTELADIFASEGNPISQSVISKLEKSKKIHLLHLQMLSRHTPSIST